MDFLTVSAADRGVKKTGRVNSPVDDGTAERDIAGAGFSRY